MKAEILTIGDELLIGQVVNSNQSYIAGKLNAAGVQVQRMMTVGDDEPEILDAFARAWAGAELVIVTGGLGPTHDDMTRTAVCTFFRTDLVPNDEVRKHVEELLKKRNIAWTAAAEGQTLVPRKAKIIPNPVGTAAGFLFEEDRKYFIVLPGVPYEMKEMVDRSVMPFLATRVKESVIRQITLRTTGIPESLLALQLGDLDELLQGARLAFLPSPTGVRMRITVRDRSAERAEAILREAEQRIRAKVQKYIYGIEDEELEEVVGRLLQEKGLKLAIAESCTGGLVADRITDVSGSSAYFMQGYVTYSNASKTMLLGVPEEVLREHGAVSKEVAVAMAVGARTRAGTDIGLSTTGIAGPTGGTAEKPVGLVWIGYSDASGALGLRFQLGDNRRRTKERAAQAALELLRRKILNIH